MWELEPGVSPAAVHRVNPLDGCSLRNQADAFKPEVPRVVALRTGQGCCKSSFLFAFFTAQL